MQFCTILLGLFITLAPRLGYSQNRLHLETNLTNIVYIGLRNPLTIQVEGIPSEELIVHCEGDTLTHQGNTNYQLKLKDRFPGTAQLVVEHPLTGQRWTRRLQVRPIPVRATIALQQEGTISAKEMQTQLGIMTQMINIGVCGRCQTSSYTLHYIPAVGASQIITAKGARFTGTVQALVQQAAVGDRYFFTNIKVRCPGDRMPRPVSSIFLMIKA